MLSFLTSLRAVRRSPQRAHGDAGTRGRREVFVASEDEPTANLRDRPSEPVFRNIRGEIRVQGAPALQNYASLVAGSFENETEVDVPVRPVAPAVALRRLCAGRIDVAAIVDDLSPDPTCARGSVELMAVPVAHFAVAVATPPALQLRCLPVAQVRRVWQRGSEVDTLAALAPGLPPAQPLGLVAARRRSATADLFATRVLGPAGQLRDDCGEVETYPSFVTRLEDGRANHGFFNFAEIDQASPESVRAVAIDRGSGCVEPTNETVQSGRYPIASALSMVVSKQELRDRVELAAFMRFATALRSAS